MWNCILQFQNLISRSVESVAFKNHTHLVLTPKRLVYINRTFYGLPGMYIVQPNTAHL
jgi:hypothetical protein